MSNQNKPQISFFYLLRMLSKGWQIAALYGIFFCLFYEIGHIELYLKSANTSHKTVAVKRKRGETLINAQPNSLSLFSLDSTIMDYK